MLSSSSSATGKPIISYDTVLRTIATHEPNLYVGYQYNLTEITAMLSVEQLKNFLWFWEFRQHYAALYNDGFHDDSAIMVPRVAEDVQHAWPHCAIQLDLERLRIGRNAYIVLLEQEHTGTSVHFIPFHLHPYQHESL